MEDGLLGGDGADEVVAVAEEAGAAELEVEGGRDGVEEEVGALEVGLGGGDAVGVAEEEGGDAEAGLHLHHREEGGRGLHHRLQALDRLPHLPSPLRVVGQPPQPLRRRFHPLSLSLSLSLPSGEGDPAGV